MKKIRERYKAMNGWQKAGLIIGLPILAVFYIALSPIILIGWGITSVDDLFNEPDPY